MLKTNSKKVKETIKTYIIDNFKDWLEENIQYNETLKNIDTDDYTSVCNQIVKQFHIEKVKLDKQYEARKITLQELFSDWCSELCSIIDTNYYLHSAVDLLGEWLEETEEEKARYTESQAQKLITNLLYREIMNHATNTNILY